MASSRPRRAATLKRLRPSDEDSKRVEQPEEHALQMPSTRSGRNKVQAPDPGALVAPSTLLSRSRTREPPSTVVGCPSPPRRARRTKPCSGTNGPLVKGLPPPASLDHGLCPDPGHPASHNADVTRPALSTAVASPPVAPAAVSSVKPSQSTCAKRASRSADSPGSRAGDGLEVAEERGLTPKGSRTTDPAHGGGATGSAARKPRRRGARSTNPRSCDDSPPENAATFGTDASAAAVSASAAGANPLLVTSDVDCGAPDSPIDTPIAPVDLSESDGAGGKKAVTFGHVEVKTFKRAVGGTVVPGQGSWPLSLSHVHDVAGEHHAGSVDEFEARRQEELRRRTEALPRSLRQIVTGETRQFDFKSDEGGRVVNPLFGKLDESARKTLLHENDHLVTLAGDSLDQDNAVETASTEQMVAQVDAAGGPVCSCLPPLSSARTWPVARLKTELKRYKIKNLSGNKDVLLERLFNLPEVAENWHSYEACKPPRAKRGRKSAAGAGAGGSAGNESCQCVVAEIPCHAYCSCVVEGLCCNPHGHTAFDEEAVKAHRKAVLASVNTVSSGSAPGSARRTRRRRH